MPEWRFDVTVAVQCQMAVQFQSGDPMPERRSDVRVAVRCQSSGLLSEWRLDVRVAA